MERDGDLHLVGGPRPVHSAAFRGSMPLALQLPQQLSLPASWSDAVALAEQTSDLCAAVEYFRGVLGNGWQGWTAGHHLARSFHTTIQGNQREWVRLHQLARALSCSSNVELLVRDLGSSSWRNHVAAEQALEFCARMCSFQHRVEVIQNTDAISPDVRVWLHDRPVTVEFKALHDPEERADWDRFEEELMLGLMRRLGGSAFPFRADFDPPALEHVESVLDAIVEVVTSRDEAFRVLPHDSGRARFDLDGRGWTLPVGQHDDLTRIGSNLRAKWVRQLQTVTGPTLLVVLTRAMFPSSRTVESVHRAVAALTETLARRKMIGAVLLHEEPFEAAPPHALHVDANWRFTMGAHEGRARFALLVNNTAARVPLTVQELEPLVGTFMHW